MKLYDEAEWKNKQYPTVILTVPDSKLKDKTEKYFDEARDNVFASEGDLPFEVLK